MTEHEDTQRRESGKEIQMKGKKTETPSTAAAADATPDELKKQIGQLQDELSKLQCLQRHREEEKGISDEVRDANSELVQIDNDVDALKKRRKGVEERRERLLAELLDAIDGQGNLFTQAAPTEAETAAPQSPAPSTASDAWRDVLLADVWAAYDGNPKLLALLKDGKRKDGSVVEIETLGQLADFTADGKTMLTDIKGIGQEKATKIDQLLERYWADHPQTETAAPAEQPPAAEPEPQTSDPQPDAERIYTPEELGVTAREIDEARCPALLADLQSRKWGRIPQDPLIVRDAFYAAVPIDGDADYMLLPIYGLDAEVKPDGGEYTGKRVGAKGPEFQIGPAVEILRVSTQQAQKAVTAA